MADDLLTKNIKALQKHKSYVLPVIEEYFKSLDAQKSAQLIESDGFHNLKYFSKKQEWKFLYRKSLQEEYERSCEISKLNYPRILIFDGFGLGYHFFEYLKNKPKHVRDVLVLEENVEFFVNALKIHDLTEWIEQDGIAFCVGLRREYFFHFINKYITTRERWIYSDRLEHFYFEPSLNENGEYYVEFAKVWQDVVTHQRTNLAPGEDNYRAFVNIMKNFSEVENALTIHPLKGFLKGHAAVFIGAGPSLNDHISFLNQYQNDFFLMAADAAVKPLLKNGIVPHMVVSTERTSGTKYLFDHLPKDFSAPLLTLPSLYPVSWESYPGEKILLRRTATFGSWLWPDLEECAVPLGVCPTGFSILDYFGCSKVYLIGNEFAYDQQNQTTHASEADDFLTKATQEQLKACSHEVEGNDGNTVITTEYYNNFAKELERLIFEMKTLCFNVIAKEKGRKIQGAPVINPQDFWTNPAHRSHRDINYHQLVSEKVSEMKKDFKPSFCTEELWQKTRDYLQEVIERTYQFMQDISFDYHDKVSLICYDPYSEESEKHLESWRLKQEEIIEIDRPLFYFFLNCFFGSSHIWNMAQREAMIPKEGLTEDFIHAFLLHTEQWGLELAGWANRALFLGDKYVATQSQSDD